MKTVTYCGQFDAVEIETAPAFWATVERGGSLEVSDAIAVGLLAQEDQWKQAKTSKTKDEV